MWNANHKEMDEASAAPPTGPASRTSSGATRCASSGQEDLILTARRRMIGSYGNVDVPKPAPYVGIDIVSPLEATPRVATSGPGDDRSGGARRHRGLDIVGTIGEPVRAIADGIVIFAGVNMPDQARIAASRPTRSSATGTGAWASAASTSASSTRPTPSAIVSCYMHLDRYNVAEREQVLAGQIIGEVGRTGVKVSPPHLHFEVRVDDRFTNPLRTLGALMIPPKATLTHQYVVRAKRAKARLRA